MFGLPLAMDGRRWSPLASLWRLQNSVPIKIIEHARYTGFILLSASTHELTSCRKHIHLARGMRRQSARYQLAQHHACKKVARDTGDAPPSPGSARDVFAALSHDMESARSQGGGAGGGVFTQSFTREAEGVAEQCMLHACAVW